MVHSLRPWKYIYIDNVSSAVCVYVLHKCTPIDYEPQLERRRNTLVPFGRSYLGNTLMPAHYSQNEAHSATGHDINHPRKKY